MDKWRICFITPYLKGGFNNKWEKHRGDEESKIDVVGGINICGKGLFTSESGVFTNLEVDKKVIYIYLAYHNTTFIIGNKKHILEKLQKNICIYR